MALRLGLPPEPAAYRLRTDGDIATLQAIRAGFGVCRAMPARLFPESFELGLDCWLAMHEDLRSVLRMRLVYDHLAEGLGACVGSRAG